MSKLRFLLTLVSLLLLSAVLVLPATAQAIAPLGVGERALVMLTSNQPAVAYEFDNEAASDTTMTVTYLGPAFPLVADWYGSDGSLLESFTVSRAGLAPSVRLPEDMITLVLSGAGGATGRATISLTVDAPAGAMWGEDPATMADDDEWGWGEDPATMADDDWYLYDTEPFPQSGEWLLSYVTHGNSCPDELSLEDMWMPAEGTTHWLSFSGDEDALALELHEMVAADEIAADPTFFEVYEGGFPNSWTVLPGIQTGPYEYRYRVVDSDHVEIEYIERLALTDCEMRVHYDLTLINASDTGGTSRGRSSGGTDLSNWTTIGGATAPTLQSDPFAPEGILCATDRAAGADIWFFRAPEEFVEQLQYGYGMTLEYYLRLDRAENAPPYHDVEMVIGNGIELVHYSGTSPTTNWTRFRIPLTADAPWLDLSQTFPTDDPDMLAQMLTDATQLFIRGDYAGSSTACLAGVSLR